jgi:hypothetical protein
VQSLNARNTQLSAHIEDRVTDQREDVVHMRDIGPMLLNQPTEITRSARESLQSSRNSHPIGPAGLVHFVIAAGVHDHLMTRPKQEVTLSIDHNILTAR